ncbi:uncharacterized protein MONOS_18682 [Monocercomonoides exilis]|uniref:uncharacterized protein n=1 Tax=Monocercomonoides exilis TaxID=2049356 RepID=UPI00355A2EC0|nr:hypothetical protein MONOS_18682 [Monocercomonoides exilis]
MSTSAPERFNELLCELEHCNEDEQRKKIGEMNEIVDRMREDEHKSVFSTELYDKIYKMIEEKKMTMENAILLLKHVGYCDVLKNFWNPFVEKSSLSRRFEKMIFEEEKKEKKNENFLVDLCECHLFLKNGSSYELLSICVPCLLKAASKKEESEETQKEVEIALLALCEIGFFNLKQEQYLKDITEIIKHQQKHRNLTKIAYQSVWDFFIHRFWFDNSLEEVIVNKMHFGREAARELEELTRNVNWKRKEVEPGKETREVFILMRWLQTFSIYFQSCRLKNEENVELLKNIVQVYRAAKGNNGVICNLCISSLRIAVQRRVVKVEDLLNGGAVDTVLEEMQRPKLNDNMAYECFQFLVNVSYRLKGKEKSENDEMKRKAIKMEIFEKMEEEGYEDTITTFHKIFEFLNKKYFNELPFNISDYFVYV